MIQTNTISKRRYKAPFTQKPCNPRAQETARFVGPLYVIHRMGIQSNKLDERSLIPGLFLITVNNYKIIIIPNNSLNPAHPIVVA